MRDIKHIFGGRKKARHDSTQNSFSRLPAEKPGRKIKLRLLLPLTILLLAVYPVASLLLSTTPAISSSRKTSPGTRTSGGPLDPYQSFQISADALPHMSLRDNLLVAPTADGGSITYAINPELQERVESVMAKFGVPYGAFVAIEPKSGRVLALAGHSAIDPGWNKLSCFGLYPMASLFKIITAAAALEENKISPDTVFAFNGSTTSEDPKMWGIRPGRRNQEMSLTVAMGKSVNPVFGRLASDMVGKESIMACAERFGFNQALMPAACVVPSRAEPPRDDLELRLMGAGLGREVKISPFHAALMMAAIANNGVMMVPSLAEQVTNRSGDTVFNLQQQAARRMVSPETAERLARMLSTTVSSGTSRRAFHDRRGRPMLPSLDIAAKTGSIDGTDPAGHYSWFAAYAPIGDPQIALVALVINQPKWKIKASYLGEQALEAYFR